jgi:hypothetical protein
MAKTRSKKKQITSEYILPEGRALVLRTCDENLRSHGGFQWPKSGPVECPDWSPEVKCGNGLHGLLWGEGDGSLLSFDDGTKWMVVEIDPVSAVELSGKIKFPRGVVVFVGDRNSAPAFLQSHGGQGRSIVSGTATAGYSGTATAGYRGTATAGYSGTATAGYSGTATAGDRGTATAGESGTATAGYRGTATAGYRGTATAGESGTATAGDSGTATAGYRGTATAGESGTATAGDRGTATAGYRGTAKSGEIGIVAIRWYDDAKGRYRLAVGYVGEDGIKANTFYRCSDSGKLE